MAGLLESILGDDETKDEYGQTQADRRQAIWQGMIKGGGLLAAAGLRQSDDSRAKMVGEAFGAAADIPNQMTAQRTALSQEALRRQNILGSKQQIEQGKQTMEMNAQKIAQTAARQAYINTPEFKRGIAHLSEREQAAAIFAYLHDDSASFTKLVDPKKDWPKLGAGGSGDFQDEHGNIWHQPLVGPPVMVYKVGVGYVPPTPAGSTPPAVVPPAATPPGGTGTTPPPGGTGTTPPPPPPPAPVVTPPPPPPVVVPPAPVPADPNVPTATLPPPPPPPVVIPTPPRPAPQMSAAPPGAIPPPPDAGGGQGGSGRRQAHRPYPGAAGVLDDGGDGTLTSPQVQLAQVPPSPPPAPAPRPPQMSVPAMPAPTAPVPAAPVPPPAPVVPAHERTGARFDADGNMVGLPNRPGYKYFDPTNFADYNPAIIKEVDKLDPTGTMGREVARIAQYRQPGKTEESSGRGNRVMAEYNKQVMDFVDRYTNGDYQRDNYDEFKKFKNEYSAAGQTGRNMIALNTVAGHRGALYDAVKEAMPGDSSQFENRMTMAVRKQFGDASITNMDAAKLAVSEELSRAFKGANVSDHDVEQWKGLLNNAQTAKQWQGVISEIGHLLAEREKNVKQKYNQDFQGRRNAGDFISDENKAKAKYIDEHPLYVEKNEGGGSGGKPAVPSVTKGKDENGNPVYRIQ